MFRSSSSVTDLLRRSQAETPPVHQLGKPKQTIAMVASLILLLLFVSIAAATRREHNNQVQVEKVQAAMARLYAENFTIKANRGPLAREDSYGVAAAKPAQPPPPFFSFGSQTNNTSASRRIEDIKELDKL